MTVLADNELHKWASNGGLTPYDSACVNPASVDLRWSGKVRESKNVQYDYAFSLEDYRNPEKKKFIVDHMFFPEVDVPGYIFQPNKFYLLSTLEYIKIPDDLCGTIALKSTMGRLGFESLHAGFFDPGFEGNGVLECLMVSVWSLELRKGDRVVQMILQDLTSVPSKTYDVTGRYMFQQGAEPAR